MVGITAYGAYVPLFRLGKGTAGWSGAGEKAVANFDEDSITMAVAAVRDCLDRDSRQEVGALYFATNNPPYLEKQAAAVIATATDLPEGLLAVDYAHSIRAGTMALKVALDTVKAGSAHQVMAVAADARLGQPRSNLEQNSGDGATALLIGDKDVIATFVDGHFIVHEILDVWRTSGEAFTRSWEDRFILEAGYNKLVTQVVTELLKRNKLTPKDIARLVLYSPDARRHRELSRALGFAPEQVQNPLYGVLGNTGCAYAPMMLAAALEESKPGDRLLLANYGDGADAMLFQVTDAITKFPGRRGMKGYLAAKKILPDYQAYLNWRGLYQPDSGVRRPAQPGPSAAALHREKDKVLKLLGARCRTCGTIQYPPQRVCTRCHAKDNSDPVHLADKRGTVYTYSMDYIAGTTDVPLVITVINFDGGGRMLCTMTDRDINEVKVGMPVEMSFRRLFTAEGIHNYFWKSIPVRT